jgi:hypothetical protein
LKENPGKSGIWAEVRVLWPSRRNKKNIFFLLKVALQVAGPDFERVCLKIQSEAFGGIFPRDQYFDTEFWSCGDGGITGSIQGDITNNAALVFNRFDNVSFGE